MTENQNMALNLYLARVKTLLTEAENWCRALGLSVERSATTINEERHGQYEAPTLLIEDAKGKRIAQLLPFGEAVIGAMGRVDVVGDYGKREKIVYLNAGGPVIAMRVRADDTDWNEESARKLYRGVEAEGWYWVSPLPIRRAFPITKEVFVDLLGAVTGHEFKF